MHYRVLGPIGVERDGVAVGVGGPQQRRLLAVLLVQRGNVVSVDRLVDALWPDDDPPDGAARTVMTYVSRLRAALGDTVVQTTAAGYLLDVSAATIDADQFEAALERAEQSLPDEALGLYDQALAGWRGQPFGEFSDEWWAVGEVMRLRERRVLAREERAACLLAMGHPRRAIPDLEALTADEPLRERPVQLLMSALHESGRTADALRCFQQFRSRLADETGFDPSTGLVALERSMASDETPGTAVAGRPLRGYTIHDVIGEGAFGRVYAAIQPGTNRRVAIKAIRPDLADTSEFVIRFEAEAQLVARLEHPHVVPLYDYWREPGGAFLVFRLLGGGSVRESVITGGPWSLERVDLMVNQVGSALLAAHAAQVVHGDISARNVLLDDEGAAYLTDFGIAALHGASNGDVRGDVADVARMVWEVLSGTAAPTGPLPSLVGKLSGDVADGLDALLTRATGERGYDSMAEFLLAWHAVVEHAVPTAGSSSERRAVDSARRHQADRMRQDVLAGVNPYRGLATFEEADAGLFFGRSEIVASLLDELDTAGFVAVVGASGSGKSSVVRAGLVPALRARRRPVVILVPGERPVAALAAARREVATAADPGRWPPNVVLVVDQFEELWTRAEAGERATFLDELLGRVAATPGATVVVALRADLLDEPLLDPRVGPLLSAGSTLLAPLTPAQLEEAISLPAQRAGVQIEPAALATLIAESSTRPGSLPLLQFVLRELYDQRVDGLMGLAALEALGGLVGAVGRRADEVYESLGPDDRDASRTLFARLLVPAGGSAGVVATRRRVPFAELSAGEQRTAERYVAARLVRTDRDPTSREPTYEVAHEAIGERWGRLTEWLADDREWVEQLHHVVGAAQAWDASGRHDGDLYRGTRLEAMLESVAAGRALAPLEVAFVEASRAARDAELLRARRSARRLRRAVVAVAAALVVAMVGGAVAVVQRREASRSANEAEVAAREAEAAAEAAAVSERDAQIEALVGRAESLRSTRRDVAALLAIEAFRLADTPRTRSALLGTFTADVGYLDTHRFDQEFGSSGIVLPDGESAYLLDPGGSFRAYDLDTGEVGQPLAVMGNGVGQFALLRAPASGDFVAVVAQADRPDGGIETAVAVIDVPSGRMRFEPVILPGGSPSAVVASDGSRLFVSREGSADVVALDTRDGEVLGTLPGLSPGAGGGVAIASGRRLVVGSDQGVVRIVDGVTLEVQSTITVPESTSWTLRSDGQEVVVGSGPNGVIRIDLVELTTKWVHVDLAGRCLVTQLAIAADAVFCGDEYGRLEERDLSTGLVRRQLDAQNGNSGQLWVADGGRELVSFSNNEPVVARWRLDGTGPISRRLEVGWHPLGFDPSGSMLLLERSQRVLSPDLFTLQTKVIDIRTGEDVLSDVGMIGANWGGDGRLVGAVVDERGVEVAFRSTATGEVTRTGQLLDPVPETLAVGEGYGAFAGAFIDPESPTRDAIVQPFVDGRLVEPRIPVSGFVGLAISPSGHRIAVATFDGVQVYDGRTGEPLGPGLDDATARGVYITYDDELVVARMGGELTVHDLDTTEFRRNLGGNRGFVQGVGSSRNRSMLATRSGDRSVNLYDAASGNRLGPPMAIGDDEVTAMALSADGTMLVTGGGPDDGAILWDLRPTAWIAAACGVAGRNLTVDEWDTFIGDLTGYHPTCGS